MSYKDELQPASFRGVRFGIRDVDTTIGRRNVLHEYPMRDAPYSEDLGKKAREFNVNAFVMNPNDYNASKQLKSALEDYATPGTFIHPSLGAFTVVPRQCTHRYSNQEGGIEYFNVVFVETADNNFPEVTVDTRTNVRNRVTDYLSESVTYFASKFKVDGYSDFIAENAISNLNSYVSKFRGLINFGSAKSQNPTAFSKLISRLDKFSNNIPTLIFDPSSLAQQMNDLNQDLNASFRNDIALANLIQQRLWKYGDDFVLIIATTNLREIENTNQEQLIILVRNSVIAELIRNVSYTTFASAEDAANTRDNVDEKAHQQLLELADNFDDAIFTSLTDSLTAMIKDIQARAAAAKNTQYFLVSDPLPALCVAYEYYEDASQDADVIARNNIINPCFVPPNTEVAIVI